MTTRPLFDHPACLLTHLSAHVQNELTEHLAPLGIHPRHFGLLNLLVEQDDQTQHQLCQPLNVHRNVMVSLIDELEQRGLVERRRHATDRRAHAVHLLPAGRDLHAKAEALVTEFEAALFSGLDDREATSLFALLQRVSERAGVLDGVHHGLTSPVPDRQSSKTGSHKGGGIVTL